jgi:hypothetical protein
MAQDSFGCRTRSTGNNSFLNVVACCHECNALKQGNEATKFLRSRYRAGLLSQGELQERLGILERLKSGLLIPELPQGTS